MADSSKYPIPEEMMNTINACAVGLGAAGVAGGAIGPGADLVIVPVWVGMVVKLAKQAGRSLDEQYAKKLCLAVATGAGTFLAGTKLATTAASWIFALPTLGISVLLNMGVNAGLNGVLTRAFGRAVAIYFLQTEKIESVEVVAKLLLASVGLEFGRHSGGDALA